MSETPRTTAHAANLKIAISAVEDNEFSGADLIGCMQVMSEEITLSRKDYAALLARCEAAEGALDYYAMGGVGGLHAREHFQKYPKEAKDGE